MRVPRAGIRPCYAARHDSELRLVPHIGQIVTKSWSNEGDALRREQNSNISLCRLLGVVSWRSGFRDKDLAPLKTSAHASSRTSTKKLAGIVVRVA